MCAIKDTPLKKKTQLKNYINMDYLCDHPASYFSSLCCAGTHIHIYQTLKRSVIYQISFPQTIFLLLQIISFYIPFIGLYTYYIIYILGPLTVFSKDDAQLTLGILSCVGIIFLVIGLIMNCYRWRRRNIIETENVKILIQQQGKEIVIASEESIRDVPCFGDKSLQHNKRIPSEQPNRWNLVYRWINAVIFVYLLALLFAEVLNLDVNEDEEVTYWFSYGQGLFVMVMVVNILRYFVTFCVGLKMIDAEYNYIINKETGKVQLRYFMDYLCDHPVGFILGGLYPDAEGALLQGLVWNITFPEKPFLYMNICLLYLPIIILNLSYTFSYQNAFEIGAYLCGIGILSNGWRIEMKNHVEFVNANKTK